jgi:hypothetical protein
VYSLLQIHFSTTLSKTSAPFDKRFEAKAREGAGNHRLGLVFQHYKTGIISMPGKNLHYPNFEFC